MEAIEPKLMAAITAAVHAYIEEMRQAEVLEEVVVVAPPVERINLWAIAGRQDLMLQRRLWQMRVH